MPNCDPAGVGGELAGWGVEAPEREGPPRRREVMATGVGTEAVGVGADTGMARLFCCSRYD